MNKSELIDAIATKTGLTKSAVGQVVNAMMGEVVATVSEGGMVTLVGFGTFRPVVRAGREVKNPKTGERIKIETQMAPRFSAGSTFKEQVAARARMRG
ncbi:MAG: HU family DNA-binding protein [Gammaproteobacteria bacterium]|nr:HU family DNA-binding protein [Gammaproteobacteria bacterium]MBU1655745.1 HU family DNA-binding protein [Gammaproteobacteria bacterium]MBU1960706.1 HU family DNA-binding protein [Gammaproteobacteria bacterium]